MTWIHRANTAEIHETQVCSCVHCNTADQRLNLNIFMEVSKIAGGYISKIGKIDKLARAAHGLVCLANVLGAFTNPASLMALIGTIALNAASMIGSIIGDMIGKRVKNLLGMSLLPVALLQSYIARLLAAISSLERTFIGVDNKAGNLLDYIFNTQDCAAQVARLMNCMSKLIAKKVTNKILPKIDNVFAKLEREVADEVFKTGGLLEQQVGRRVRTVEKLASQLSILR